MAPPPIKSEAPPIALATAPNTGSGY